MNSCNELERRANFLQVSLQVVKRVTASITVFPQIYIISRCQNPVSRTFLYVIYTPSGDFDPPTHYSIYVTLYLRSDAITPLAGHSFVQGLDLRLAPPHVHTHAYTHTHVRTHTHTHTHRYLHYNSVLAKEWKSGAPPLLIISMQFSFDVVERM